MKKLSFIVLLMSIIATSIISCNSSPNYNNNPSYNNQPKTTEELKAELKEQEFKNPLGYLVDENVTLKPNQKMIHAGGLFRKPEYAIDGAIVNGDFVNKATLAKFKDIIIKMSYYTQTQTLIEEHSYVIYQYSNPGSITHFTGKIDAPPPQEASFSCIIMGATPVYK